MLKQLDMFLSQLSQADGILCHWIFKRLAYPCNDFTSDGAVHDGFAEEDYADEGFGYASQEEDQQQLCFMLFYQTLIYVNNFVGRCAKDQVM